MCTGALVAVVVVVVVVQGAGGVQSLPQVAAHAREETACREGQRTRGSGPWKGVRARRAWA